MDSRQKTGVCSKARLLYVVFAAYSLQFSSGAAISWPSPNLPRLNLSSTEKGLISSVFALGQAPGQFVTSLGMDLVGRKLTHFLVAAAFLLEWILHLSSTSVVPVVIGRFFGGVGLGGAFSIVPVYIAELADDGWRGPLNSVLQSFLAVGFLVEYVVGPRVNYSTLCWISLGLLLVFVVLFAFAPESPHFHLAKGRSTEAADVLRSLRGQHLPEEEIYRELAVIKSSHARERSLPSANPCRTLLTTPAGRRGVALGILLVSLQQGTAINPFLAYVHTILDEANLNVSSSLVSVLIPLTHLVSSLPVPFLVRLLGYKVLFFISSLGAAISMGLMGTYFCLLRYNYDTSNLTFLLGLGMVLFNVFFCIALGPLAWAVIAELYSPSVKSLAVGICGVFSALFGFLVAEVFSYASDAYGFDTVFFGFGIYLVLGAISCIFFVPDTSKMSFQEIQDLLAS